MRVVRDWKQVRKAVEPPPLEIIWHVSEPPRMALLQGRDWTRWLPMVPSNLNHSTNYLYFPSFLSLKPSDQAKLREVLVL